MIKNKAVMKKIAAVVTALAVTVCMMPAAVSARAVTKDMGGSVSVTIGNNVLTTQDKAAWDGTLFTTRVTCKDGMTMGDAVKAACEKEGVTYTATSSTYGDYLTEVNGLSAGSQADGMDGFMTAVNDSYNNLGFKTTVSSGDAVTISYSLDYGKDIGEDYSTLNAKLGSLTSTKGTLSPKFSGTTTNYLLNVPAGTAYVKLTPTAANRYADVTITSGGATYKASQNIPVAQGTKIAVKGSMTVTDYTTNKTASESKTYSITVNEQLAAPSSFKVKAGKKKAALTWSKAAGAQTYRVYRATKKSGTFKKIATVKGTSYTNKNLKSKKTYYYKVRAVKTVSKIANYSAYTNIVSAKTK